MKNKLFFPCVILILIIVIITMYFYSRNTDNSISYQEQTNPILPLPETLSGPSGDLKISFMPYVYDSLYKVENIEDPEHAINTLLNFQYLVCAEPGHLVEKEIQVTNAIRSKVNIFGYVHMGGKPLAPLSKIKKEIDNIKMHGWYGVFIDQFGYDFDETRDRQNSIIEYAHTQGLTCFVNSWNIDDAFSDSIDPNHNPKGLPSSLSKGDWYLMESFYVSNSGYTNKPDAMMEKLQKAQFYKNKFQANIAVLSYKRDIASWEESETDIKNSYLLSLLAGFDAWWYTDHLENNSFIYGKPLDLNLGNKLTNSLVHLNNNNFISRTDKYALLLNINSFPSLLLEAYPSTTQNSIINRIIEKFQNKN